MLTFDSSVRKRLRGLKNTGGNAEMQFEFLKQFPKRMKHVGMYGILLQNSLQKQTWKNYGLIKPDEQLNFIFALLLYIMEQSLKEENCTLDDIGSYQIGRAHV